MSSRETIESAHEAIHLAHVEAVLEDLSWIGPIPKDSWAMSPDALRFVSRLIQRLQPRHVLEFGSGLSTHDPEFCRMTESEFFRTPQEKTNLVFQLAPLVLREFGDSPRPAYALRRSLFASQRPVDLTLVDGPPAMMGGREGVLYQAVSLSRAGSIIILDDASRKEELTALDRLPRFLGDAVQVEHLSGFQRGLAAVYVTEPVSCTDVGSYHLRLLSAEIRSVYRGGCVILIDEDQFRGQLNLGCLVYPFLENNGEYCGPPPDDPAAICELQRLQLAGATLLVITWPSFWWLDHYLAFREHLEAHFRCLLRSPRVIVFELTHSGQNECFLPGKDQSGAGQQE